MGLEYRRSDTEADIVAELYYRFRCKGIVPRMEVKLPSLIMQSGFIRCDMAIMCGATILAVIEVKAHGRIDPISSKTYARMCAANKQDRAYESFSRNTGIPVFWVRGRKNIAGIVQKVLDLMV